MTDKDRTLKALEDMKESMAYAVRRKQQIGHGPFYEEEYVRMIEAQRDELAEALRGVMGLVQLIGYGVAGDGKLHTKNHRYVDAELAIAKLNGTSTVAQDK